MPHRIYAFLSRETPASRAHFIGKARDYIKNDNLINLLQNFDINNIKANIRLSNQFIAFEGIPGLTGQVTAWMNSRVV
jgi:hypothetical protein